MENTGLSKKQKLRHWLIILSAIPSFIIVVLVVSTLANGIYAQINGYNFFESPENIAGSLISQVIFQNFDTTIAVLVLVWIYWVKIQKNTFVSIGFGRSKGWLREIALGLAAGVLLLGAIFGLLLLTGNIKIEQIKLAPSSLIKYLFVFLLVGFNEELLTRGYLLGSIKQLANKKFALVLVAVMFSLMHIFNDNFSLIPFLNIILAGILLGVVYIYTGRLWFAISLHFTWNFLQGPVFGSHVSGSETESVFQISTTGSPLLTGGDFGFEGSLIMTVLMILLIAAIGYSYHRKTIPEA